MTAEACEGVLVVDDDDDIRDTMIETLVDEGYHAVGARHGLEALATLRAMARLPCVILLDIMMPVMDGRAFRAEQLLDPALRGVPVVVVTAHADIRETERELAASGALRKPFSIEQLFAAAEHHCGDPRGHP